MRGILLAVLAGLIISLLISGKEVLLLGILASIILFILLVRKPELSLAILFNGTLIYFYLAYKIGYEPDRLLTGGFYAFLAGSFLLGGLWLIKSKPENFDIKLTDLLFACFFFMVFISYFLFSTENGNAFKKIAYAPLLVVAPFLGSRFLASNESILKFLKISVLIPAILMIPAFYELLFNPAISAGGRFSMFIFSVKGDNPILFGITFSIAFLILFIWMMEKRKFKIIYLLLLIPFMFLVFRSGARGALISLVATILIYFLFLGNLKFKSKAYSIIFIVLLLTITYKFIPKETISFYKYSLSVQAQTDKQSSVHQRINMWVQAISDFKENPIRGVGMGNSVEGSGYPHNILLETSAELGIPGLLVFLALCFVTVKKAWKFITANKNSDSNIFMKISLLLFIFSLCEAMVSGQLTGQTQLFICIGLIASISIRKESEELLITDVAQKCK